LRNGASSTDWPPAAQAERARAAVRAQQAEAVAGLGAARLDAEGDDVLAAAVADRHDAARRILVPPGPDGAVLERPDWTPA
jgi:hypothetical protein